MKGIEWKEFVECAYYGTDAFLQYHNRIYKYGGYYENCFCIEVYSWIKDGRNDDVVEELHITSDTNMDIWNQFLNAKLFEGKTLEEAGDDVEFLDWG